MFCGGQEYNMQTINDGSRRS